MIGSVIQQIHEWKFDNVVGGGVVCFTVCCFCQRGLSLFADLGELGPTFYGNATFDGNDVFCNTILVRILLVSFRYVYSSARPLV